MKLLIAEDERDLADALTVLLERNKYAVDTVYNGAMRMSTRARGSMTG